MVPWQSPKVANKDNFFLKYTISRIFSQFIIVSLCLCVCVFF